MRRFGAIILLGCLLLTARGIRATDVLTFRDLFNGKDLAGWVNVNTAEDTWRVENGMLVCSGHPIGVMRTTKQYENFVLHVEWMHTEPGGNSGMFLWSGPNANQGSPFPNGVEVQMLELEWPNLHKKDGKTPPVAYVHGELFGVGKVKTDPDNPRGPRSMSIENRCKGRGEWNTYDVVAVDGVLKLSVNGKFVNGISHTTQKKGYISMESEGAKIFFRNIRIMELPPGVTSPEQSAPEPE
jgi:3-keto-disaccharide hydrolase